MADSAFDEIMTELGRTFLSCQECGGDLIGQNHWRQASLEERQEMLEDGWLEPGSHRLCINCLAPRTEKQELHRERMRIGRSRDWPAILTERLSDLDSGRTTCAAIAREYDVHSSTVTGHLRRLRKRLSE